jgi:hypothetical protein
MNMRKAVISGLAAFLLGAATARSQGPVAHWSFDSGFAGFLANDSVSPDRQLVVLQGVDSVRLVPGVSGKALYFTAPGYDIQARNSRDVFNYAYVTVEAVIRYSGGNPTIFHYSQFHPGIASGYWLGFQADGSAEFTTGNSSIEPNWNRCMSAPNSVQPGKVYHIAGVLDDKGFNKVYLDGQEVAAVPTLPYQHYNGALHVACNYGDGALGGWFINGGSLDELKVYDRPVGADEIRSHYLAVKDALDKLNRAP